LFEKGGFEGSQGHSGVGERIAGAAAQLVRTRRWIYLEMAFSWRCTPIPPRAQDLGKVNDWVVIYLHSADGGEAQHTVVTAT
jgi:hypothetical protein